MKPSPERFSAARRGAGLAAAALIAGVALAPAASADDPATGTLPDALLQSLASASANGSGAADVETIGGADRGAIVMGTDGSFTATFTVSKALVEDEGGNAADNVGIYTYAGGGATHAAWETYQPISFAEPATGSLGSLTGLFPII